MKRVSFITDKNHADIKLKQSSTEIRVLFILRYFYGIFFWASSIENSFWWGDPEANLSFNWRYSVSKQQFVVHWHLITYWAHTGRHRGTWLIAWITLRRCTHFCISKHVALVLECNLTAAKFILKYFTYIGMWLHTIWNRFKYFSQRNAYSKARSWWIVKLPII